MGTPTPTPVVLTPAERLIVLRALEAERERAIRAAMTSSYADAPDHRERATQLAAVAAKLRVRA